MIVAKPDSSKSELKKGTRILNLWPLGPHISELRGYVDA